MKRIRWPQAALLLAALALAGCAAEHSAQPEPAVAIAPGDVGAGCGMVIDGSPGPRAEAWIDGYTAPLKFGSTRDFFAYVLQPEHRLRVGHLYVQDSAAIDWRQPTDAAASFIAAREAYYVAWQPRLGMMGPTFASFATRSAADAFVARNGGQVLRFRDITPELVGLLEAGCPAPDSPAAALAAGCVVHGGPERLAAGAPPGN